MSIFILTESSSPLPVDRSSIYRLLGTGMNAHFFLLALITARPIFICKVPAPSLGFVQTSDLLRGFRTTLTIGGDIPYCKHRNLDKHVTILLALPMYAVSVECCRRSLTARLRKCGCARVFPG